MPIGLLIRRLRPFGLALVIQIAVMIKGGYLPYFYVTAMLPFAALLLGGIADTLCNPIGRARRARHATAGEMRSGWLSRTTWIAALAAAVVFTLLAVPRWGAALRQQADVRGDASSLAATAWILRNIPPQDVVVVDDYMWTDLRLAGRHPLWLWKVDTDPQVSRRALPRGYQSIDYIVLAPQAASTLETLPTLNAALRHSVVVADFGDGITARKVIAGLTVR